MDTLHKIMDLLWKNGMTEADFCNKVGINKSAVTDWKKGKTKSYMKHIPKIADVLNVSADYLLEKTEIPNMIDKQLEGVNFALYGEVQNLTDKQKEEVLKFVQFLKSKNEEN